MNNRIETPVNRQLEPGLRVPTFSLEDVLGVHSTYQELPPTKNDALIETVSFLPDSIDAHLGLFIAGVLGDLTIDAIDENGWIRMHHKTLRVIEDFEVQYLKRIPETNTVIHVFPYSEEVAANVDTPGDYEQYPEQPLIFLAYSDGQPLRQVPEALLMVQSQQIETPTTP